MRRAVAGVCASVARSSRATLAASSACSGVSSIGTWASSAASGLGVGVDLGQQHAVLGGEVVRDGARGHVDRVGDLLHRGVLVALLTDQAGGRIDQLGARRLLLAFPKALPLAFFPHGP